MKWYSDTNWNCAISDLFTEHKLISVVVAFFHSAKTSCILNCLVWFGLVPFFQRSLCSTQNVSVFFLAMHSALFTKPNAGLYMYHRRDGCHSVSPLARFVPTLSLVYLITPTQTVLGACPLSRFPRLSPSCPPSLTCPVTLAAGGFVTLSLAVVGTCTWLSCFSYLLCFFFVVIDYMWQVFTHFPEKYVC